jgi:GLPGLI family protein
MKRKTLLLVMLLAFLSAHAQMASLYLLDEMKDGKEIDKVNYEIVYQLQEMFDTLKNQHFKELMLLQIGDSASAFFSYPRYQSDSLVLAMKKKGETNIQVNINSNVSWKLYKGYPAGKSRYLDNVSQNYVCEEPIEVPKWQLVADSLDTIAGYPCRLATAFYKGRLWRAWYAEDVPIDNGPWKLQGLPGLILKASDSQQQYVFTAVGLHHAGRQPLLYPGSKCEPISRRNLVKLCARFNADNIGFLIEANKGMKITFTDDKGNTLKHSRPIPYNEIER